MTKSNPTVLLRDHAYLAWEAEVENARRIAAKRNVSLTQIAAILAVLVFKVANEKSVAYLGGSVAGKVTLFLLAVAFAKLAQSLVGLVVSGAKPKQGSAKKMASHDLLLDDAALLDDEECNPVEVARDVYTHTVLATIELQVRNTAEVGRIRKAQQDLATGAVILFVSLFVYLLTASLSAIPDMTDGEEVARIGVSTIDPGVPEAELNSESDSDR